MFSGLYKTFLCLMVVILLSACTSSSVVVKRESTLSKLKSIGLPKKPTTTVKRVKSGIYIIKDENTLNNTGYSFDTQADNQQIGPGEIKFDYEDFRTRY